MGGVCMTGDREPTGARSVDIRSLVAGLVVAALVAAVAGALLVARQEQWSATASLLVVPDAGDAEPDVVAGLYDALSRGQVPATYAELLRDLGLEDDEGERQGLSAAALREIALEVVVVPDTSVLDLTVTAPQPGLAESVAEGVLVQSQEFLSGLESPYTVVSVGAAAGKAHRVGLPALPLAGVVAAVALLAGAAAQQAVAGLSRARRTSVVERADGSLRPVPVVIVASEPADPADVAPEPDLAARRRPLRRR